MKLTDRKATDARKAAYEAPQIVELGSLAELTMWHPCHHGHTTIGHHHVPIHCSH